MRGLELGNCSGFHGTGGADGMTSNPGIPAASSPMAMLEGAVGAAVDDRQPCDADVTVVVVSWNSGAWLPRTMRSLATQTVRPARIVVVDNGSSDGTAAMVEALARDDERVRYVSEPRIGLSCARNAGARAARFEYLAYLDDDGRVDPTFIGVVRR